jgi:hypothetical protein
LPPPYIVLFSKYHQGDKNKEDEISAKYSMHGRKISKIFKPLKLKGKDRFRGLGIEGWMLLDWILKK